MLQAGHKTEKWLSIVTSKIIIVLAIAVLLNTSFYLAVSVQVGRCLAKWYQDGSEKSGPGEANAKNLSWDLVLHVRGDQ